MQNPDTTSEDNQGEPELPKQNRAQKRAGLRNVKRLTRPPIACIQMYHPLMDSLLTPHGKKVIKQRRMRNEMAKRARRMNRGK